MMKANFWRAHWTQPALWLLFGCLIFPIMCISAQMAESVTLRYWHLGKTLPYSWGGMGGIVLGVPLGIVSALCAILWRARQQNIARCLAFIGGVAVGGGWILLLRPIWPLVWLYEFGFAVPPLIWSLALALFGLLARPPRAIAEF